MAVMNRHRRSETRSPSLTVKISTPNFAPVYAHIAHDGNGKVLGLAISHPGRFSQTQVGGLLDALAEAIDEGIRELSP
jgi:hypothetical protein